MGQLDWQAAFYRAKANDFFPDRDHQFVFVAAEKSYPFACSLIALSEADMRRSSAQVFEALDELCELVKSDSFGVGYGEKVWEISLGGNEK